MLEAWNLIKKEILAQVFSCEVCEISKNTYFYRTTLVAATDAVNNARRSAEETLDFAEDCN